jgi:hypothetical protein
MYKMAVEVKLSARIKAKIRPIWEKYGRKILEYVEAFGLMISIFFLLALRFKMSFMLFVSSVGLYFVYQEVMTDIKSLFRNFRG